MNFIDRIKKLANVTEETLSPCIGLDENGCKGLIDPLDHKIIRAHYAETHYSVGLLLKALNDESSEEEMLAKELISVILERIDEDSHLPGYHNDFNLFALCIAYDFLEGKDEVLAEQIRKKVLDISDSNHNTTNWLPMRIFVNEHRYSWTGATKYPNLCQNLLADIKSVAYKDGFIDDRSPKGISFNLQYDVATVAVLVYVQLRYELKYDITSALGALLKAVLPDGDINYLGRGCNQIFAWGLWIYLLSTTGQDKELDRALSYLEERLPDMLKNNNILLNEREGEDKYLWWDYLYSSVYTSHLFMWLVLAIYDYHKNPVEAIGSSCSDSGVQIYTSSQYKVVIFNGRKEYLAERGPAIAGIWCAKYGSICKGYLGPWQGTFGQRYTENDVVLRNFFGLLSVKKNKDFSSSRILRKLGLSMYIKPFVTIHPIFANISINISNNRLTISYSTKVRAPKVMNIPILCCSSINNMDFEIFSDGQRMRTIKVGTIEVQYGAAILYQSVISCAKEWKLTIKL